MVEKYIILNRERHEFVQCLAYNEVYYTDDWRKALMINSTECAFALADELTTIDYQKHTAEMIRYEMAVGF